MLKRVFLLLTFALSLLIHNSYAQCSERKQNEIEATHIKDATKMFELFDKKISETEFENRVSNLLNEMYKNFCSGESLRFAGKIGNLKIENNSNIYVRIDNKLSFKEYTLMFNYQTTRPLSSEIGEKLNKSINVGDTVFFSFSIGNFFHPYNRSDIVDRIKNGTAGSFPMDLMWEGVNSTIPNDVDYVYPVMINLEEILKPSELFVDETGKRDIKILNGKVEYYVTNKKGNELAEVVSSRTLEHFGKYKSHALYYSESQLQELGMYDIIFTLLLRNIFTPKELLNASNKDIFAAQYFRLNSSLTSNEEITIKDINIKTENKAEAHLYIGDKKQSGKISYVKEKGEWKVDFYSSFKKMRNKFNELNSQIEQKGYTIKEFSIYLLKQKFPHVKNNIWEPMNR